MSVHHPAVDVGTPPPPGNRPWETTEVRIHGFADRLAAGGERGGSRGIASPTFEMCGRRWRLRLFPGGTARAAEGMCSAVLLGDRSEDRVDVQWGLIVRDGDGRLVANVLSRRMEHVASPRTGSVTAAVCVHDFAPRSALLEAVQCGTLVVEVRLRPDQPLVPPPPPSFDSPNPFGKKMLNLFLDEESADVSFVVGSGDDGIHAPRRAKTPLSPAPKSTTTFYAHRLILQECAPLLADLCASGGSSTAVHIPDVKPEVFRLLLYNVYGGEVTDDDLAGDVTDVIDAADRYGVVHLKLKAEACYVRSNPIAVDNATEQLLYANAKNLALLREAVADFLAENDVVNATGNESFERVPGDDVAKDVSIAAARRRGEGAGVGDAEGRFAAMRVGELRKRLDEKGLDVDGSRRVLVATLREHSSD